MAVTVAKCFANRKKFVKTEIMESIERTKLKSAMTLELSRVGVDEDKTDCDAYEILLEYTRNAL